MWGTTLDTYCGVFTAHGTAAGGNAVRAIVESPASGNFSAAVAALNTVAPGSGQLNFGLYAQVAGAGQAVRGDGQTGAPTATGPPRRRSSMCRISRAS